MKNSIQVVLLTLFSSLIGLAQNDCSAFYPFEEGVNFTITSYGKKDKVAAIADYTVTNVTDNTAVISTSLKDDKGEVMNEGSFSIECDNGGITMDMKSLLNPQMFEQFKDFDTEITGNGIVLPNTLNVGQELPDAAMYMKISMSGINMNMEVEMTDRKVIAQESVTTPAGTFDCYVITYTSNVKMGMNHTGSAKQWIAKGVGMVKQEDYNKRGKVTSSSLLTSFSK